MSMEVIAPVSCFALIPVDYGDKEEVDLKAEEEVVKELSSRRDSNGSTGYSTCSSAELLPHLSQQSSSGSSPAAEESGLGEDNSEEKDRKVEEQDIISRKEEDAAQLNGEMGVTLVDRFHLAGEAASRCHSAGFRGHQPADSLLDNLRRGSNGYHSREETRQRLVATPNSLGEAITLVIQGLEANIASLRADHVRVVQQLRAEQEARFVTFSQDQEETLLRISENIAQTELETRRIKEEAERNVDTLRTSLQEVSVAEEERVTDETEEDEERDTTALIENHKEEVVESEETKQALIDENIKPSLLIQDLTSNIDKISLENKSAVGQLLGNLERAKRENDDILHRHNQAIEQLRLSHEAAFEHLRAELEKVKDLNEILQSDAKEQEEARLENLAGLTAKLEAQEAALHSLEKTVASLTGQTDSVASDLRRSQSESLSCLRAEVVGQMEVASQLAASVQHSLDERLASLQA